MSREIGGRPHHQPAEIGGDAHGDHVALNEFTDADARIEPLFVKIDRRIVDVDLDRDIRAGLPEFRQHPQEHKIHRDMWH